MFASKHRESRRERTFIGSVCAACEEPLEHTLRNERILQLSCGHVAHEACFYEYIKEFEAQSCPTCEAPLGVDTSRGGGIDFGELNKVIRSAQSPDMGDRRRDPPMTPTPWDVDTNRQGVQANQSSPRRPQRQTRDHLLPEQTRSNSFRHDNTHGRNQSADTGQVSSADYADTHHTSVRRHDYDVQSMESSLSSPRHLTRNPIPAPTVTVRSEFPTLSKSRQQESLTCLITVEVVDGKWQPNPDDLRSPPPVPATIPEEHEEPKPEPKLRHRREPAPQIDSVHDDSQALERVKEELYSRCENWHGLDFERFGRLILHATIRVGKDRQAWQELECYLFTEMLICVKAKKISPTASQQWEGQEGPKAKSKVTLKGSILIKKHLKHVEVLPGEYCYPPKSDTHADRDLQNRRSSLSVSPWPSFLTSIYSSCSTPDWRCGGRHC